MRSIAGTFADFFVINTVCLLGYDDGKLKPEKRFICTHGVTLMEKNGITFTP